MVYFLWRSWKKKGPMIDDVIWVLEVIAEF